MNLRHRRPEVAEPEGVPVVPGLTPGRPRGPVAQAVQVARDAPAARRGREEAASAEFAPGLE